jgi:hypothetical protein
MEAKPSLKPSARYPQTPTKRLNCHFAQSTAHPLPS